VLSQPPDTEQQVTANGEQQANGSTDVSNRNRKYYSSTTTRLNGDRLPLVVADNQLLTSEVRIVDNDSLRIVVDGFQVPRRHDATSGGSTEPVSVRIDVAMTTGGSGGGRVARSRDEGPAGIRRDKGQSAALRDEVPAGFRRQPMLVARNPMMSANRDVINTRAMGPSFCR